MATELPAWLRKKLSFIDQTATYRVPEYPKASLSRASRTIRLDSNENLMVPPELMDEIVAEATNSLDLRTYPREELDELLDSIAKYVDLPAEYIALGNGSDQLIDFICRSFFNQSGLIVSLAPSFPYYRDRVTFAGGRFLDVHLNRDFQIPKDETSRRLKDAQGFIICSPNNPTGNRFDPKIVLDLLESFDGLVMLDEAYVDFADGSMLPDLKAHPNLIILRTFSKGFGLAGLRLGFMMADPEITSRIQTSVQYPYGVGKLPLRIASAALKRSPTFREIAGRVKRERSRMMRELRNFDGMMPYSSEANFILTSMGKRLDDVHRRLVERDVLIRRMGDFPQAVGCARITVGTAEMNSAFLDALREAAG